MAIRYESTPISLYGQLGQLAGEAQRAKEEQRQREEQILQIRQMQHQNEMAEFQAKLNIQAEMKARQWELQKAEINSQYELQERLRMESALKDRDLQKQMARDEQYERVVKEVNRQFPEGSGLEPLSDEIQALKQNLLSKAVFERSGMDIQVPYAPKQPSVPVEKPVPTLTPAGENTLLVQASRFLSKYEDNYKGKGPHVLDPVSLSWKPASAAEQQLAKHYQQKIYGLTSEETPKYKVGESITWGGIKYRITGLNPDGSPRGVAE